MTASRTNRPRRPVGEGLPVLGGADLAAEAVAARERDLERLAAQLVLLYDGASVSAQMDHDASAAASARAAAALMLDAAVAGSPLLAPAESVS